MVMIEATTNPTQEAYYSCILETCTRTVLTNRAQKVIIELGVNIQDLRFTMANNKFKLIKNNTGKLTYIPEEHYTPMVKNIAKRNKEVKINGGSTRKETYPDPRDIYNNEELSAHANKFVKKGDPFKETQEKRHSISANHQNEIMRTNRENEYHWKNEEREKHQIDDNK